MNVQEQLADLSGKFSAYLAGGETKLTDANNKITVLNGEKTALEAKVLDLTGKKTTAETDLATAKAKIVELEASVKSKDTEITTLNAGAKKLDEAAADKAIDMVAGQAIPEKQTPETKGGAGDKKAAAKKEYARLVASGDSLEAGKFYTKNKELLWD